MTGEVFYLVWREVGGCNPSKRHDTYKKALEEAKRLAKKTPDTQFFVLESISCTVSADTSTEMLKVPRYKSECVNDIL